MVLDEVGTRFELTKYMLGSVIILAIIILALSAFKVEVPEFISGVIITGFMLMLKDAYASYFKAREELQTARLEVERGKQPVPVESVA